MNMVGNKGIKFFLLFVISLSSLFGLEYGSEYDNSQKLDAVNYYEKANNDIILNKYEDAYANALRADEIVSAKKGYDEVVIDKSAGILKDYPFAPKAKTINYTGNKEYKIYEIIKKIKNRIPPEAFIVMQYYNNSSEVKFFIKNLGKSNFDNFTITNGLNKVEIGNIKAGESVDRAITLDLNNEVKFSEKYNHNLYPISLK